MAWLRKVGIAIVLGVSTLAAAGQARAQASPSNAPTLVPVEISTTQPGSYIRLRGAGGEFPCGERCVLYLPQHQYRVLVRDPEGNESASALNIFHPTSMIVSPGNHDDKVLGIGLFAGGVAATAAGAAVLFVAMLENAGSGWANCSLVDCSGPPTWMWYAGGISLAGGLAVGTAGMILWKTNARCALGTRPLGAARLPAPVARLRLTPTAGRQWAGLGLAGRF